MEEGKKVSQTSQQISHDYTDNDLTVDSKNPYVDNESFALRKRKTLISNYISIAIVLILVILLIVYLSPLHRSYNGKTIIITRGFACKFDSSKALDLLEKKDPEGYKLVFDYLGKIQCVSRGSRVEILTPPTFFLGDKTRKVGEIWLAAYFVHEATHIKLYNDYLAKNPGVEVPDNIASGEAAEIKCLDAQYISLKKIGADQAMLDSIISSKSSHYWDIPRWQRDW